MHYSSQNSPRESQKVWIFLLAASFLVTLSACLLHQAELKSQLASQEAELKTMEHAKGELEEDLKGAQKEIEQAQKEVEHTEEDYQNQLAAQENEYEKKMDELKAEKQEYRKENQQLMEIVEKRYETYQTAVNMEGDDMNLLSPSGFTAGMLERAFSIQNASSLQGSGEEFIRAERETGVNALALAAIAAHESAWGESSLARQQNNFFGWGADGSGGFESFSSREENILTVSRGLRHNYLSRGGSLYYGRDLEAVNTRYAADAEWHSKVAGQMKTIAQHAVKNPGEKRELLREH